MYSWHLLLIGLISIHSSNGQGIVKGVKSCIQLPEDCTLILELGRDTIKANLQQLTAPKSNTTIDIPKRLSEIRDFFGLLRETDCQLQRCTCEKEDLACHPLRDDIRALFSSIKFPSCVLHSPLTGRLLDRFRNSVSEGNHARTLLTLNRLRLVAIFEMTQRDNEKVINCILEIVESIRAPIRQLIHYDTQRNCEFCNSV